MAAKKKGAGKKKGGDAGTKDIGTNVAARVERDMLFLTINLKEKHGETPKGFRRIATTHGNVEVPGHASIRLGLNIYDREA